MSLEDLVAAKKTQRDKDWPMLRRLVDASYATARDGVVTDALVAFRLAKLRSPQFLVELVAAYPDAAAQSSRPVVQALLRDAEADAALGQEQAAIMAMDREYWLPLRRELEALRHQARRSE